MESTATDWFTRWKAARRQHFSSVEKLRESLAPEFPRLQLSTINAWEGSGRSSYPGPTYRVALAALNREFAALVAEIPERPSGGLEGAIRRTLIEVLHEIQFPRLDRLESRLAEIEGRQDKGTDELNRLFDALEERSQLLADRLELLETGRSRGAEDL